MIDCVKCFLEINQNHTCEQSFLKTNFNFISKVRQTSVCGVMLPKSRLVFIQYCNLEMLIDYQESVLVCTNCGVFEYYPIYVSSYNHTMQPSRRKCIYKRSDNFKVILNQFLCIQNRKVPDEVIRTLWNQINNKDNLLYN